jgi:hypothetical protein
VQRGSARKAFVRKQPICDGPSDHGPLYKVREERKSDHDEYRLVEPYRERDATKGYGHRSRGNAEHLSFPHAFDVKSLDIKYQQGKDNSSAEAHEIVNSNPDQAPILKFSPTIEKNLSAG